MTKSYQNYDRRNEVSKMILISKIKFKKEYNYTLYAVSTNKRQKYRKKND